MFKVSVFAKDGRLIGTSYWDSFEDAQMFSSSCLENYLSHGFIVNVTVENVDLSDEIVSFIKKYSQRFVSSSEFLDILLSDLVDSISLSVKTDMGCTYCVNLCSGSEFEVYCLN